MIKINLLGDALSQGGGKKSDRAEPAQIYGEGEGGGRPGLPIAGIIVGLLFASIGGVYYIFLNNEVQRAETRKADLERQRDELKKFIDLEKTFREKKEMLAKKEEIMQGLRKNQQLPVHFLEELANSLPDDVWFREITQRGMSINIKGEARSFEAINLFYSRLQSRTRWFKNINYPGAERKGNNLEFSLSFDLQNPA
ncbi:MAG: PilN domain-containing protein [Holophagaceae bacterium]|nr:PilN domain-containing protein [Holophagaceae bacterium]